MALEGEAQLSFEKLVLVVVERHTIVHVLGQQSAVVVLLHDVGVHQVIPLSGVQQVGLAACLFKLTK